MCGGVTVWPLNSCQCDSGGIFHDVTKTRMDLEQFSAPSLLIVCVLRGGNFLSCFQTWQSSNALGNDLFAIKWSTLRMYWHRTGYFFLILIACNLEWLLSRLVCQVVSSLMLMARLDTKENISSRRNLTETRTVKDSKVTSWLQIPPAIWLCQDSRIIDMIIVFSDDGSQQAEIKCLIHSQHLLHFKEIRQFLA